MRKNLESTISLFAIVITAIVAVHLGGCTRTAQVQSSTALSAVEESAPGQVMPTQEMSDEEMQRLLDEYDDDGNGSAYIPPTASVIMGRPRIIIGSSEVAVQGRVVERQLTSETIRMPDGRVVRIERHSGGSVTCSVGDVDCSWEAPEDVALDAGRQIGPDGVVVLLPEPAAEALREALQ